MSKHLPPKLNKHEKEPQPSVLNTPLRERKSSRIKNELTELGWQNYLYIASSVLLLIVALALGDRGWLTIAFYAAAFLLASFQVVLRAADEVLSIQLLEADILLLVSGIAAFALEHYAGAVLVMLSYRICRLLEGYFNISNQKLSEVFTSFLPETATLVTERGLDEIEAERIAENDILEVKAGERFPVDGTVIEGSSTMDASLFIANMSGVSITEGNYVLSGCMNLSNTVRIKAESMYAQSNAFVISELLENANRYKPKQEKFTASLERFYTPAVVLIALVTALLFPAFSGRWADYLSRAAAILALSGCGLLAISINYAYRSGLVWAVRRGIVVKGTRFFEELARAQTFVFNKTGTLTEGRYAVVDLVPEGIGEQELLAMAAHAESNCDHPIAKAICKAYGANAGLGLNVKTEEISGMGVSSMVGGKHVYVGNAALLAEHGIECPIPKRGGAAIHVAVNGTYAGHILVTDRIRENAFDQLERLRIQGVKNLITLTADVRSVVRPLAASLNMDMVRAELSPEGKVSAVEYLSATKAERSTLAYVCNAAGDPEALSRADVGISLGALGSFDAYERGDVLVFSQRLGALADIMGISKLVRAVGGINILLTLMVKAILLALAFFGALGIGAIVLIDLVLSALLCGNSIRVLNYNIESRRKYR